MSVRVEESKTRVVPLGELRDRVTIQRPTTVADALGGQTVTWTDVYANIPAKVQSVRTRENELLDRDVTVRTFLITVQYGYVINTTDRVSWNGSLMNIRSAENRDGRRRRLTMECEVGVAT